MDIIDLSKYRENGKYNYKRIEEDIIKNFAENYKNVLSEVEYNFYIKYILPNRIKNIKKSKKKNKIIYY